jgi:hypothetical protein
VVNLAGLSGVDEFADIRQRTDADGNAVADLRGGDTITFVGLTWDDLSAEDFLF